MSEMGGVPAPGNEQYQKQQYYERYQESLDCFQKSFSDYRAKKGNTDQLQKVMDESLQVMNQIAKKALSDAKLKANDQLNSDYKSYIKDPSEEKATDVENDIKTLG